MEEENDMLEKFPLLLPNTNCTSWSGYIFLKTQSVFVKLLCPRFPSLENLSLNILRIDDVNLQHFELEKIVKQTTKQTGSVPEFLSRLTTVLDCSLSSTLPDVALLPLRIDHDRFCAIIGEIKNVVFYIDSIAEDLSHIKFTVNDESQRKHFIKVNVSNDYPMIKKQPMEFDAVVPSVIMNSLLKVNTIVELFDEFKKGVSSLNDFWNVHEDILKTCNVIDSYTLADVCFKIPIDKHVIVNVEVDPLNPLCCPDFKLQGQCEDTQKFQQRLHEINPISIWSTYKSFKDNVVEVFGVEMIASQYEEMPGPSNESSYCFICYDELDATSKKQTKVCVNSKCDAVYHITCICEWILNSASNTPMYGHLQGKCPQCEEDLLVALDNFDLINK
ncbi:E3 ubiquitin-protein ligase FANCL-like [Adelges cooleyi]|uniref:E3 ubiquitin-protein ligase FANCL-like n=1 Tax=Adelges cooleyi TaxID=133065 RepID=UPI00218044BE|nr:E3 ubiquitin-protein ligase FANCL-like [Adelges cooleyi]